MHFVSDFLATHGLDWQFEKNLSEDDILGPDSAGFIRGFAVLDIRERLLDGPNYPSIYPELVSEAISLIQKHGKVVICCSAGVSRSNSIAVGVLMRYLHMDFHSALELVIDKVPMANPLMCHLECIKELGENE